MGCLLIFLNIGNLGYCIWGTLHLFGAEEWMLRGIVLFVVFMHLLFSLSMNAHSQSEEE